MSFIKTLKIDDIKNLDLVSGYYYWISTNDIKKIPNTNSEEYYLPCYPFEMKINNFNNLIDVDVLLFMNKPKIIYGALKIKSILTKEKEEKQELVYLKTDLEVEEELNKMVIVDTEKFLNLVNAFNVANIPELFFIKFEKILIFEFRVDFNKFGVYIANKYKEIDYELKYPKKINNKNIIKSYYTNSLNLYLLDYLNYLKKNNKDDIIQKNIFDDLKDTSEISETSEISQTTDETSKKIGSKTDMNLSDTCINFDIPILYNGCKIIKKSFKGNISLTKKMLVEHLENCADCEIINNSSKKIKLNKKIVIKVILNKNNYKTFDEIIFSYQNVKKLSLKKDNEDFSFEKEKINIVFCPEYKNLYSECVFIL